MSDIEKLQKEIEDLKVPRRPDLPGRETPMPPNGALYPIEDEEEKPKVNRPKGSAGY